MASHTSYTGYDNPIGRPAERQQQMLHRQNSRPFEAYNGMANTEMYPQQEHGNMVRFEQGRFDRMNSQMNNQMGGQMPYGNDMYQSQSWNPAAFNSNQFPAAYPGTNRIHKQPTRGRNPIPNVSSVNQNGRSRTLMIYRHG